MIKKAVGRPTVISYSIMIKLADSIQHNATITEACRYAGISRDTYYRYLGNEVFAEKWLPQKTTRIRWCLVF
jgi:ACT domain-containing protein